MCNPVDTRIEISDVNSMTFRCLFVFSLNGAKFVMTIMMSHEDEMAFMHGTNEVNILLD